MIQGSLYGVRASDFIPDSVSSQDEAEASDDSSDWDLNYNDDEEASDDDDEYEKADSELYNRMAERYKNATKVQNQWTSQKVMTKDQRVKEWISQRLIGAYTEDGSEDAHMNASEVYVQVNTDVNNIPAAEIYNSEETQDYIIDTPTLNMTRHLKDIMDRQLEG
jgi:hypothetical protein